MRFMLEALRDHPLMVGTAEVLVDAARWSRSLLLRRNATPSPLPTKDPTVVSQARP
jgi:hypothetical protein